jgi:anaphase-promoting complex subunit 8
MGHEFLEMKNIPSSIESYRTAVDLENNDYRAWYGLGQTYEIHQMYQYAIYYFLNAAKAKPNDSRMWTALAANYEKVEKKQEAIKCYKKAILVKDKEGIEDYLELGMALYRIAKLYASLGEEDKAAEYFEENMKKCSLSEEEVESSEYIDTVLFLAKFYKNQGKLDLAYNFLIKLKDYEGQVKIN